MRIFLTGMMGCGKSFWAKKIAAHHQIPCIDLDTTIEINTGFSIIEIFEQKGESWFRQEENKNLQEIILDYEHCIVATGGGTPCFHHNMHLMKNAGIVIYLKSDIDILAKRISDSPQARPLIAHEGAHAIAQQLERLYNERKKFYEQSDITIDMNQIDETTFAANFIKKYV